MDGFRLFQGGVGRSSGRWLVLDRLGHLLGTVVGQAQAHDGQHHGDLVHGPVVRLGLDLSGHLPLWPIGAETQRGEGVKGHTPETTDHSRHSIMSTKTP